MIVSQSSNRRHGRRVRIGAALVAAALWSLPAAAQWTTQTITLNPGWNAVFLEVQPEPHDLDSVLQGVPVKCAWFWNKRNETVQYVQDPSELMPEQPDWLKYFPPGSPHAAFTNLYAFQGGRPYLIQLDGDSAHQWQVKGHPVLRSPDWVEDSFNFAGFNVADDNTMTFLDYFSASAAHAGQPVLQLDSGGHWVEVAASSTDPIRRGEAYWVYANGASDYVGPLSVDVGDDTGVTYSRTADEVSAVLQNARGTDVTVTLAPADSEQPPAGDLTVLAGSVPLSVYEMDLAGGQMGWVPLEGSAAFTVPAGGETTVRLAVRRADMVPSGPPPEGGDVLYQSLLEVTDGLGLLLRLSVSARGLDSTVPVSAKLTKSGEKVFAIPAAGLWQGHVAINAVSQPANQNPEVGPAMPQPTASEFQFPLIVHVDYEGRARLLQQVYVLWQDGTYTEPGEDGLAEVDEPGRYVLVTDDTLLDEFKGSTIRDGAQVGRRVSSAAFSHREPLEMLGVFGETLSMKGARAITLDYDDPLNPFKHRYHPDHGMERARATVRADGSNSEWYTVTREIELAFSAEDPELGDTARWGDRIHGGTYRETLVGIHKEMLYVEGLFRLTKVVDVPVLNDGRE